MQWPSVIIGMLAAYGAAASTYLIAAPRIKLQRSLFIRLSLGYVNQSAGLSETMVILSATNRGQKLVALTTAGLRLPKRGAVTFLKIDGEATLPHLLASGKSVRFWIPAYRVARALKESGASGRARITGLFSDDFDRSYHSAGLSFDRDAFEQASLEPANTPMATAAYAASPMVTPEPVGAFKW